MTEITVKVLDSLTREDVIKQVMAYCNWGELKSASRVGLGFVNENWILETIHDRYFLKRRHPQLCIRRSSAPTRLHLWHLAFGLAQAIDGKDFCLAKASEILGE